MEVALAGREVRCSNFLGREKGKREKKARKGQRREKMKGEGQEGNERRERKRDRMGWYMGKEEESM